MNLISVESFFQETNRLPSFDRLAEALGARLLLALGLLPGVDLAGGMLGFRLAAALFRARPSQLQRFQLEFRGVAPIVSLAHGLLLLDLV
jgi:hypothetical protein